MAQGDFREKWKGESEKSICEVVAWPGVLTTFVKSWSLGFGKCQVFAKSLAWFWNLHKTFAKSFGQVLIVAKSFSKSYPLRPTKDSFTWSKG